MPKAKRLSENEQLAEKRRSGDSSSEFPFWQESKNLVFGETLLHGFQTGIVFLHQLKNVILTFQYSIIKIAHFKYWTQFP